MTDKLHDDILRELPDDFIRRMRNWARSLDGGSVGTCSALWGNVGSGSFESRIPVLMGESEDTERALRAIPQKYGECVAIFWTNETKTLRWMATATPRVRLWKLGATSFGDRLERGHELLVKEVARLRKAAGERRERTEEAKNGR